MRFYTAQPASRVSAIKCGKDVVPDWSKHPLADPNAKAYRYLLDTFNEHNATSALGLIFGYAFENLNALREAVRKAGMPSGAYFPGREMLVVNVLKPNGKMFELPVTHIPLIKAEWVTKIVGQ